MTNTALSRLIANAILDTIERDGACNRGNIEEAVFRELAVAEARLREAATLHVMPARVLDRLHNAGLHLLSEIRTHHFVGKHSCFDDAVTDFQNALKEAMA